MNDDPVQEMDNGRAPLVGGLGDCRERNRAGHDAGEFGEDGITEEHEEGNQSEEDESDDAEESGDANDEMLIMDGGE
jgi:hypothetical protein